MTCNPYDIVCEILGQPAEQMQNPVNEDYLCPYRASICSKRSQKMEGPFPVCSVFRKKRDENTATPIVVCPKRLFAADIYNDVIKYCWPGPKPQNPIAVHEIKMGKVGNVDMVIADLENDKKSIRDFVSIELQAIDITGSYEPAYTAIVLNTELNKRPTYNFNYKNVQKRFITQMIDKGYYHHHWGTRIIAVIQDVMFEELKSRLNFADIDTDKSDIVFMQYGMALVDSLEGKRYDLKLKKISGTTHNELMMRSLYQKSPPKEEFCKRILKVYNATNL